MRYDELRHTQIMHWNCSKGAPSGQRNFLKKLQAKRRRIWNKKLTEIEMNTNRESYSSPYLAPITERVQGSGSPSGL